MLNGIFAGFFFWWDFGEFAYIEHFAIASSARNGGTGGHALDMFIESLDGKGVVLEAEPETDGGMARRRIAFYRRHGFDTVDGFVYIQPPYSPGKNELELTLMTAGRCPDAKTMANTLHREVYGV